MRYDDFILDKNNERQMYLMRCMQIKQALHTRAFILQKDTGDFAFRNGQANTEQGNGEWTPFTQNDFWGEREQYCQFKQHIKITEEYKGKRVLYEISPYLHAGWNNSAEQFILLINGKIQQGVDHNHSYTVLTACAEGDEEYDILLYAYCDDWRYHGKIQLKGTLMAENADVIKLYYDLDSLLETASLFGVDDNNRIDIIKAVNDAVNLLELETPDEQLFLSSVKAADEYLHRHIFGKRNEVVISCIGHTHIDVAWLWRLRQTREKAGRSFATVLQLMKEYPEYKFMSPQAQLYDYVRTDYPEVFEGIRQKIKEGRWEAEGSMWVESDTNVVSGESLVRQFMYGKGFFKEHFGIDNKIMWLPDVFGYSGALPQIMKLADIDYFMTTKISWCEYNRFPFDTFMWEGIDGTKILSHFAPSRDEDDEKEWFTTYNADISPAYAVNAWKRYSNKDLNREVLCSFGYGDGGGGPDRTMLERMRRMNEGIPGCPQTPHIFARDFFNKLQKDVQNSPRLPKWRGELYLEYHRGTLTAQARNKRYNRKSEWLAHDTETLCEVAHLLSEAPYPQKELDEIWKIILLNQFHDIIPGSSIAPVYEDSKEQYEAIIKKGTDLLTAAEDKLCSEMDIRYEGFTVFNTLGFDRTSVVTVTSPYEQDITVLDANLSFLPTQKTYDGKLIFLAKGVPAKGWKHFPVTDAPCTCFTPVQASISGAQNDYYRVTFDKDMHISSYYAKNAGQEILPQGEVMGKLTAYEDRSHQYEAWDIKCYYNQKYWEIDNVQSAEVIETGAVRTVIKVVRLFHTSVIEQYYCFYAHSPRIDIAFTVDWKEKNVALKMDCPVDVNTDRATFDIQFGSIERSTTENTSREFAQFEVCGHKWADLSDEGFGLSVLNDCKYGWTVKNGHIRPTLLRSATTPNKNQDREIHRFTYALYAHKGSVHGRNSQTVPLAYDLNAPLQGVFNHAHEGHLASFLRLISVSEENVIIETVKKAQNDDALIVRMYESANKRTACTLTTALSFALISECGVLEQNEKTVAQGSDSVDITFKPFEIKTFKLYFSPVLQKKIPQGEIKDYRTELVD